MRLFSKREQKASTSGGTAVAVQSRLDRIRDRLTVREIRRAWLDFERRIGLTRAGQIAILAAAATWVVARVIAGTPLFLFAYGTFLLVAAGYVLARRRLKLTGDRVGLYPRAQQGDRMSVEVMLHSNRRVSNFVLEERIPERLGTTVKVPIPKLAPDAEVTHPYSLRCARRGVYSIGPLVAVTSDPLGLTERETVVAEPFELLVHPRVEEVSDRPLTRQFEDPPVRPPVSKPWPSGLEFYGMREYRPGDELRRIVWRASARMGKLMVREAEQGITDKITMIIDTNRGSHSHDGEYSDSFETGVSAAASLGVRHLRDGYEVSCLTNTGPVLQPVRGHAGIVPYLDSLARIEMGREPLTTIITRQISNPRRDAHNIFVTPHLGDREAAQLQLLLNKGVSILVVALMWDEKGSRTLNLAAALGCQVAGVNPGQDLQSALYHDIGAGSR